MKRALADYGMVLVLLVLCVVLSLATLSWQTPRGEAAGTDVARLAQAQVKPGTVLIATRHNGEDERYAAAIQKTLADPAWNVVWAKGEPVDARRVLVDLNRQGSPLVAILGTDVTSKWILFEDLASDFPALGQPPMLTSQPYLWPNFLKTDNLLNIANQIAVIAIVAIGMTMVVISGGIDLSVGSLIALSAVVTCLLIERYAGAQQASILAVAGCCLVGLAVTSLCGLGNGLLITAFSIPPFIVTLGTMWIASGFASMLTGGESVYHIPESFVWLGRGADLAGLPNAVAFMLLLYMLAHYLMTRTVAGRYLYAVGGNAQAARLSGVPVRKVLWLAYTVSGLLAGVGGLVLASKLKSGSPTYGDKYEMYVIAAVVVGGTSLTGGNGKMFSTLLGAFVIAVIQNGMNLLNLESNRQKVVLGAVIVAAVLVDSLKHRTRSRGG